MSEFTTMDPEWEIAEAKLKIYLQKQLRINCYKIGADGLDQTSLENVLNASYNNCIEEFQTW